MEENNKIKLIQYVIVPKRPKMSKGKIASQAAHATFRALKQMWTTEEQEIIKKWNETGMCVIVLECKDVKQLINIHLYLKSENIVNALVVDEGLTEVPFATPTALATGVLDESEHWRFKKLELFK